MIIAPTPEFLSTIWSKAVSGHNVSDDNPPSGYADVRIEVKGAEPFLLATESLDGVLIRQIIEDLQSRPEMKSYEDQYVLRFDSTAQVWSGAALGRREKDYPQFGP